MLDRDGIVTALRLMCGGGFAPGKDCPSEIGAAPPERGIAPNSYERLSAGQSHRRTSVQLLVQSRRA